MKVQVPLTGRVMLLLDLEYSKLKKYEDFVAHLLTDATLLIAKRWKTTEVPMIKE